MYIYKYKKKIPPQKKQKQNITNEFWILKRKKLKLKFLPNNLFKIAITSLYHSINYVS